MRETNVTLMRRGSSLTVVTRFNAPTGETGYVTFPNVFTRDRWHHIVVTSSPVPPEAMTSRSTVDNVYHSTGNVTLPPNSRGLFIRRAITYKTYIFNYLFISEQKDCDGGARDQYELQAWWNPTGEWETLKTVVAAHNTTPKEYLELNVSRLAGSHLYTKFRLLERDGTPDVPDDVFVERWMTVDSSLAQPPYTFGTPLRQVGWQLRQMVRERRGKGRYAGHSPAKLGPLRRRHQRSRHLQERLRRGGAWTNSTAPAPA